MAAKKRKRRRADSAPLAPFCGQSIRQPFSRLIALLGRGQTALLGQIGNLKMPRDLGVLSRVDKKHVKANRVLCPSTRADSLNVAGLRMCTLLAFVCLSGLLGCAHPPRATKHLPSDVRQLEQLVETLQEEITQLSRDLQREPRDTRSSSQREAARAAHDDYTQIGRASCRERVYVLV